MPLTYKSNMRDYIIRRVLFTIVAFLIISMFIFFSIELTRPYPKFGDGELTKEEVNSLLEKYGWDKGLIVQYFEWIGDFFTGDLGTSLVGDSYYSK